GDPPGGSPGAEELLLAQGQGQGGHEGGRRLCRHPELRQVVPAGRADGLQALIPPAAAAGRRAFPRPGAPASPMNVYLLQIINGLGIGMLYFLLGLSIIFGLLRFVNFAHGAFYLLGAYFCFQALAWGLNFWVALAVVPVIVRLLGWLTERILLRHVYDQPHEFHILITVGLALVLQAAATLV